MPEIEPTAHMIDKSAGNSGTKLIGNSTKHGVAGSIPSTPILKNFLSELGLERVLISSGSD
jgi:hypothetical protein